MNKKTRELLIRCIDYTLFMKEIWFDKEELRDLNSLREQIKEQKEQ